MNSTQWVASIIIRENGKVFLTLKSEIWTHQHKKFTSFDFRIKLVSSIIIPQKFYLVCTFVTKKLMIICVGPGIQTRDHQVTYLLKYLLERYFWGRIMPFWDLCLLNCITFLRIWRRKKKSIRYYLAEYISRSINLKII